ncbi:uncharacterized protein N7458_003062, partial [Penicillium daleae]
MTIQKYFFAVLRYVVSLTGRTWLRYLLANFTLCEERTGDVVTLMKFIFEESDSEHIGNIRIILRDYTLWNMETLMQN